MGVGPIPSDAPQWALGIYWIIIAIGGAMVFLIPLMVKAYTDVYERIKELKENSQSTQNSANAAAINSAITARSVNPGAGSVVPDDLTNTAHASPEVVAKAVQLKGEQK